jgi:Ser/Thr protein kinase RdoA (MazF antagonist)
VYRARWRSHSDVAYEVELLTYLAGRGVSVSMPIAGTDGAATRALRAPEGTRQLVLFTFAQGKPLSWDIEDHCYLAGQVAAAVHTASDGFKSRHSRFSLDVNYLIDVPLATIRPFLAQRPDDPNSLE